MNMNKHSSIKAFFLAMIVFTPCCIFFGCYSTGVIVGENAKILKNLSGEYFAIAGAYANLKQYEKALTYYQLAQRDKNYYTASHYEIARMNALLSRWNEAQKNYEELLKNDPKNRDIAASLAYVKAMSRDLEGAQVIYSELLQENNYDRSIHENYIRVLAAQNKGAQALEAFETYKSLFTASAANTEEQAKLEELLAPFR